MKIYIIPILILISLIGCTQEKKYTLKNIDAYTFKRDHQGSDTLTGKKLEAYLNRNPIQSYEYKSKKGAFYEQLVSHGIIQNETLVLQTLDSLPDDFAYTLSNDDTIRLHISYPESFDISGRILIFRNKETIIHSDTILFDNPTKVRFSTMDLNADGTDELYALYKYHTVKGHKYQLSIYELTEK